MKKKIFTLLLSLVMVLTMMPTLAFAEDLYTGTIYLIGEDGQLSVPTEGEEQDYMIVNFSGGESYFLYSDKKFLFDGGKMTNLVYGGGDLSLTLKDFTAETNTCFYEVEGGGLNLTLKGENSISGSSIESPIMQSCESFGIIIDGDGKILISNKNVAPALWSNKLEIKKDVKKIVLRSKGEVMGTDKGAIVLAEIGENLSWKPGEEPTLPEGFAVYGSSDVDADEDSLVKATFTTDENYGYYTVNGVPAKTVMIINENEEDPEDSEGITLRDLIIGAKIVKNVVTKIVGVIEFAKKMQNPCGRCLPHPTLNPFYAMPPFGEIVKASQRLKAAQCNLIKIMNMWNPLTGFNYLYRYNH